MIRPETLPARVPRGTRISKGSSLRQYIPISLGVTFVVAVLPVWLALSIFPSNVVLSLVTSFAVSLAFGRLGTRIWQRVKSPGGLVFDDLLLWRLMARLRSSRRAAIIPDRLRTSIADGSISTEKQLRLLKKLAAALESGDPYTGGHSKRVARHAFMTARALRLSRSESRHIQVGALLHDIGKLHIPKEILNKPGRLTDEEFEVIKTHPAEGAKLVGHLNDAVITGIVRSHHERIDGTGYPDRLSGYQIPLGARIISVVDTFDAITSKRPYRDERRHREAIQVLEQEAGTQLDSNVVKAFLAYYSGRRSLLRLSFISASLRHIPDALTGLLGKAGMSGVANAVAAGGTALAIVGSGFNPLPASLGNREAASPPSASSAASDGAQPGAGLVAPGGDDTLNPGQDPGEGTMTDPKSADSKDELGQSGEGSAESPESDPELEDPATEDPATEDPALEGDTDASTPDASAPDSGTKTKEPKSDTKTNSGKSATAPRGPDANNGEPATPTPGGGQTNSPKDG